MSNGNTPEFTELELVRQSALSRLVSLRSALSSEVEGAPSPAVGRALEMADVYVFMALSYLGYSEKLYPEES